MRLLHALVLFASTGLASAKHHKSKSKTTTSTSTTTHSTSTTSSALAPTATSGVLPNIPGCMNTTSIDHDVLPSVCQIRRMIQQKGVSGLNNTIFYHSLFDVPEAAKFAESLWKYFPNSQPDNLISLDNLNRTDQKSEQVDALLNSIQTRWNNIPDSFQIWKRVDQALAQECAGTAYIVASEDVGIAEVAPHQNTSMSYFALYTYPALMRNPKIDQVIQVWEKTASWDDWDGTRGTFEQKTIWKKGMNATYTMYHADKVEDQTFRLKSRSPKQKPEKHSKMTLMKESSAATKKTLPSCHHTKAWTRNKSIPSVCQIRNMFKETGYVPKDLIFFKINGDNLELAEDASGYIYATAKDKSDRAQVHQALARIAGTYSNKTVPFKDYAAIVKASAHWTVRQREDIFSKRFQQAQAMEASGNAYVFAGEHDNLEHAAYMENTHSSYFSRYQLPALMRNPNITEIFRVYKRAFVYDSVELGDFDQKSIWKKGDKITHRLHYA